MRASREGACCPLRYLEFLRNHCGIGSTVKAGITFNRGEAQTIGSIDNSDIKRKDAFHAPIPEPLGHRLDGIPGLIVGRKTVALVNTALKYLFACGEPHQSVVDNPVLQVQKQQIINNLQTQVNNSCYLMEHSQCAPLRRGACITNTRGH